MLYSDLYYKISLYLDFNKLSVSKELHNMYNDIWFLDKLQYLNPETKLYTPTNYKSLYQKY